MPPATHNEQPATLQDRLRAAAGDKEQLKKLADALLKPHWTTRAETQVDPTTPG